MSSPSVTQPYIPVSLIGQPLGVCPLGPNATIPREYLPSHLAAPPLVPAAIGGGEIQ